MEQDPKIVASGKPQLNRKINAALVFGLIQSEGPLSRADLAKRTNIRSTSISAIVQQLLDEKLLREVGRGVSTGGRHPILMEVNPDGRLAAGIEVAEDMLNGIVLNLAGKVVCSARQDLKNTSVDSVSAGCKKLVAKLAEKAGVSQFKFAGVGVAVPGIVSKDTGSVILSHPLDWRNVPLREILSKDLGLDVHVLNNAMAGALSEYFDGMGQGVRSLLYVLVYLKHVRSQKLASLGCGIVLDGRAYFGEGHIAGEVRSDFEHPVAAAKRILGSKAPKDFDALLEASRKDPETYDQVWNSFAESVAQAISWGMDFLNPGRVVIGTDIPELAERVSEPMVNLVRKRTVAGLLADMGIISDHAGITLHYAPIRTETLARGAILPRLQELALTPLLRDSVLS